VYEIRFVRDVERDLRRLPAFHRTRVIDAIESHLVDTPMVPTRNRKPLANLIPPWTTELPIWELRVDAYRVFYDVSEEERVVYVRAVRKKSAGMTTEEML
jgi:mRNA-degrading endonuclease RelE of RelBE toxin-antitoxin system